MSGQSRDIWIINESGLYKLIFTSNKPEAKSFTKWVTDEVLPAIRKTGSYSVERTKEYDVLLDRVFSRIAALEKSVEKTEMIRNQKIGNYEIGKSYLSALKDSSKYCSVAEWCSGSSGRQILFNEAVYIGKEAVDLSGKLGYEVRQVPVHGLGIVNYFHMDILKTII